MTRLKHSVISHTFSIALRFASATLHPSEYLVLYVTATSGTVAELLRSANNIARGALVAAAQEKCMTVSADHVRVASTEII